LSGGEHDVYAWWVSKQQYSDNVTYVIRHNGQDTNVTANHRANGGTWNLLGTFVFSGDGTEFIRVTDAGGKTVADAVRFTKVLTPPPGQIEQATYFIHRDHLGTPQRMTDEAGEAVWELSHTPFGRGTPNEDVDGDANNVVLNLRFPGQYYDDETRLHYNYFRNYDSVTGRYLGSDSIGLAGGLNPYLYADGNPLRYSDPLGLQSQAVPVPGPGPLIIPPVAIPGTPENKGFVDAVTGLIDNLPAFELQCIGARCIPVPMRSDESEGTDSCPVPDTTRDRITKGNTDIRTKPGNEDTANGDFDTLNPTGVLDHGNGVRVGTLPDGRTVVLRPSRDGRPTIEIQRGGRTRIKIRYGQ
jgi:RHS repeat-associated protein